MISNKQVKFIKSLKILKYRRQYNSFVAEGPKIVGELLNSHIEIQSVFGVKSWILANNTDIPANLDLEEVSEQELHKISFLQTPNQVLAVCKIPEHTKLNPGYPNNLALLLDNISDPGNLGTIIRTADWFGIDHVICTPECADAYNPKVVQATMGSIARVRIYSPDIEEYLSGKPESVMVYGAFLDGENIYKTNLRSKGILVIGSESRGISDKIGRFVNRRLTIPRVPGNSFSAESLNVAIATGIILSTFKMNAGKY